MQLSQLSQVKYYVSKDGKQYATASNWLRLGYTVKDGATGTPVKTKAGHEFTVYTKTDVNKGVTSKVVTTPEQLFKSFMDGKLTQAQLMKRLAKLQTTA